MTSPDDPRLREYLDDVAARGADPDAVALLAEQIADMCAEQDVEAVLTQLEPAQSWGPRPRHRLGAWSLGTSLVGLLGGPVLGTLVSALGGDGASTGWLAFCILQAAALVFGLADWRDPWSRAGITGALSLPTIALILGSLFP